MEAEIVVLLREIVTRREYDGFCSIDVLSVDHFVEIY